MMFDVVQVPPDASEQNEPLGTKPKFWFQHENKTTLFKECREGTGEDWAEKIAAELAQELRLPRADIELAEWQNKRGIVTPSFVPEGGMLLHGNELLGVMIKDYPPFPGGTRAHYPVPQHTLGAVFEIVGATGVDVPMGCQPPVGATSSADIFVGYLMLDTWIGNQDRHHANWGLVVGSSGADNELPLHLAPTFDHASSLGRNESDEVRAARLSTRDSGYSVAAYAERARSAIYGSEQDNKPMTTYDAFRAAAERFPKAAHAWLGQLARIERDEMLRLAAQIPADRMSRVAREFACQLLDANRTRLLSLREEIA